MTFNVVHSLLIIAIAAGVTILLRATPFLLLGGMKKLPDIVLYLGKILPASIMAVLVVYCLRHLDFAAAPFGLPELLSVALVVVLQSRKRSIALSVFAGTVCYMLLLRLV